MNRPIGAEDPHDDIAALLPWWINGTLDAVETRRVSRHVESCARCQAERDRWREVLDTERGPRGESTERALADVMARIDASPPEGAGDGEPAHPDARPTPEPARATVASLSAVRARRRPPTGRTGRAVGSFPRALSVAAGVLVAVLAVALLSDRSPDGTTETGPYTVLSADGVAERSPVLRVVLAEPLSVERLDALLAKTPTGAPLDARITPLSDREHEIEFGAVLAPTTLLAVMEALERDRAVADVEVRP